MIKKECRSFEIEKYNNAETEKIKINKENKKYESIYLVITLLVTLALAITLLVWVIYGLPKMPKF